MRGDESPETGKADGGRGCESLGWAVIEKMRWASGSAQGDNGFPPGGSRRCWKVGLRLCVVYGNWTVLLAVCVLMFGEGWQAV